MPQPPQYTRITSFSADEANNLAGRSTVRTVNLNTEFDNAKLTLDQLVTNSGLIQRDDGKLLDGVVTQASLSVAVTALFVSIGANPRGAWLTATSYAVKDIIETGAPIAPYMCVTAHTSGVFATDYAAGRWVVLGSGLPTATQVSSTATGDVAATNVQSAIAELSSEKVAKALNGSDFANIVTTRGNLSVFSQAESQTSSYLTVIAGGTFDAITASFTPAITTLTNHQILYVRAIGANTVTNPTFTPNSGVVAVKTIKKLNNVALSIGDIAGSGHVLILQYNITVDAWFLLNPASLGVSTYIGTLLPAVDASAAQTTLGISTYLKTLLPAADAAAARAILGTTATWTSAQQLGTSLAIATVGLPALTALNGTDVAFIDDSNDSLRTYNFNGTTFAQVGSSLAIATVGSPAITALNVTDIAFIDSSNDSLRTYRFVANAWAQVGSSLAIATVGTPALAALTTTDVAFIDSVNLSLRTYRFVANAWAQVGNSLAITNVGLPALTALNSTDVAFIDSNNRTLTYYRFDGTNWSQIGSGLIIAAASFPALATFNATDVAFIDASNDSLRIYRFSNPNWLQNGTSLAISTSGFPALATINGTDVAFIDSTNLSLRVYRFGQHFGPLPYKP